MKGHAFFKGEIYASGSTLTTLKNLLQNHGANIIKLGTNYPWMREIQICSKECPCPFPRRDNIEAAKVHW